jgi:hypothetical protein
MGLMTNSKYGLLKGGFRFPVACYRAELIPELGGLPEAWFSSKFRSSKFKLD